MRRTALNMLLAVCTLAIGVAHAQVRIENAWVKAVPAVAPVAGGYMQISNDGAKEDRLLRVETSVAQRVEMHRMSNEGGVLRMRAIKDGLTLAPHAQVVFKPGSNHLMLIGLTRPLQAGDTFEATLVFEHAGRRKAMFDVRAMDAEAR